MPSSPPEQFLEWTFEYRMCGMNLIYELFTQLVLYILIGIPIAFFMRSIPVELTLLLAVAVVILLVGIILFHLLASKRTSRTLRIDRHTVTLADTGKMDLWHPKERRMKIDGATKFSAVHLDFFERLFTVDFFRVDSAYHITITRNGETFLFPCNNETEQSQIIKKIKEFLSQ